MVGAECCFLSLHELSVRIRARDLSPAEVVEAHLARIEKLNPKINAFTTVRAEEACGAGGGSRDRARPLSRSLARNSFWSQGHLRHDGGVDNSWLEDVP